jgi:integrase
VRVETRAAALAIARKLEHDAEMRKHGLVPAEGAGRLMAEVLEGFRLSLTNRAWRDDAQRLRDHVEPYWARVRVADVNVPGIVRWLDTMKAAGKLAPGTQRLVFGLLSRALSWATARGLAPGNVTALVPRGVRPRAERRRDVPWLESDHTARLLFERLPSPVELMFAVGLTSGLRLGEIAGLTLADLFDIGTGAIRVRGSNGGPLKEDKRGDGRVKWAPTSPDVAELLGKWLEVRRAEGADPASLAFPRPDGGPFQKHDVRHRWRRACEAIGVYDLNWHQATRHSFVSRALARGATLDEVSQACGHATPAITATIYGHNIRKTWSPLVAAGVGFVRPIDLATARGAKILRFAETSEPVEGEVPRGA